MAPISSWPHPQTSLPPLLNEIGRQVQTICIDLAVVFMRVTSCLSTSDNAEFPLQTRPPRVDRRHHPGTTHGLASASRARTLQSAAATRSPDSPPTPATLHTRRHARLSCGVFPARASCIWTGLRRRHPREKPRARCAAPIRRWGNIHDLFGCFARWKRAGHRNPKIRASLCAGQERLGT